MPLVCPYISLHHLLGRADPLRSMQTSMCITLKYAEDKSQNLTSFDQKQDDKLCQRF